MTRYKAIISYDGHDFSGFQRQPMLDSSGRNREKTKTVEQWSPVTVHGAGRTDAGVHAYGQVIHFDLLGARDEERLLFCPRYANSGGYRCGQGGAGSG